MRADRLMNVTCAVAIAAVAAAVPATAKAQANRPPPPRTAPAPRAPDTTRAAKGARPPSGPDILTVRRAATKGAPNRPATGRSPASPPQAPPKVKRRVP